MRVGPASIPTLSQWGLVLLSVLLALAAVRYGRRGARQ
ncbi:MAG: IPTL-CTERM sorting domain-containing protein [Burkholderiaceae bacterium]